MCRETPSPCEAVTGRRSGTRRSEEWETRRLRMSSTASNLSFSAEAAHCMPSRSNRRNSVKHIIKILLMALVGAALLAAWSGRAATPIRVMILDGESGGPYHQWQLVTSVLKKQLEETGLFQIDVVTAPPAGGDFSRFRPDFTKYQAVVFNYDAPDERWPAEIKTSFEQYLSNGGGFVSVHAADNAFPGWTAFNEMIGVGGWRGRAEKAGPYWYLKDGKLVSDNAPGPAGSHGRRTPFQVAVRQN